MPDVMRVINDLSACERDICQGCSYSGIACCRKYIAHDARILLQASYNHVLSIDEIKASDFVYIEYNQEIIVDNHIEACAVSGDHGTNTIILLLRDSGLFSYKGYFQVYDYNVTWRCWLMKPTVEQMNHAPWKSR